jgi:Tol biopolymer transport system component
MPRTILSLGLAVVLSACSTHLTRPTPAPTSAAPTSGNDSAGLPWASLNLAGRIIFTRATEGVWQLDLETGAAEQLFQPPDKNTSWINSASVSPDGQQIVVAYAPPPQPGEVQFGYTDLYLMPADGSAAPTLFLARPDPRESYFNPIWSPDGRHIYFAHLDQIQVPGSNPPEFTFQYNVERAAYPDGQPELIAPNAFWPRLSEDGAQLVYISVDPQTFDNDLHVANADGTNARRFAELADFPAVDAPLFSPDGSAILFSAVSQSIAARPGELSWLEGMMGVKTASAHNVPSDWWRIPIGGGPPEQLTKIYDTGLYGDFAPDGRHMAFLSLRGLTVMTPDGQNLAGLSSNGAYGTVDWIP